MIMCVGCCVRWAVWGMVHCGWADPSGRAAKGAWLGLWEWCRLQKDTSEPTLLFAKHCKRPCLVCIQQLLSEVEAQRSQLLLQCCCSHHCSQPKYVRKPWIPSSFSAKLILWRVICQTENHPNDVPVAFSKSWGTMLGFLVWNERTTEVPIFYTLLNIPCKSRH